MIDPTSNMAMDASLKKNVIMYEIKTQESKLYNTTPSSTPTHQAHRAEKAPLNLNSHFSSSVRSIAAPRYPLMAEVKDDLVNVISSSWRWFKLHILKIKKEPLSYSGNLLTDLHTYPDLIVKIKREYPYQFLQFFVQHFLNAPQDFFQNIPTESLLHNQALTKIFYITDFYEAAGRKLGKKGRLSVTRTLDLFQSEWVKQSRIRSYVQQINKELASAANRPKLINAQAEYVRWAKKNI